MTAKRVPPRHAEKGRKGKRFVSRSALFAALIASAASLSVSAAASLGGLGSESIGAAAADLSQTEGVTLEWNPNSGGQASTKVKEVRVSNDAGSFASGDHVKVAVADTDATGADAVCEGEAAPAGPAATLTVTFPGCELDLWDVDQVAVVYTGNDSETKYESSLGPVVGAIDGFDGQLVDPQESQAALSYGDKDGEQVIKSVNVNLPDATPTALAGGQMVVLFYAEDGDTTPSSVYAGTIGAAGVTVASAAGGSEVTMSLAELSTPAYPEASEVARYRVVVTQKQRLGAEAESTSAYGVVTAAGDVDSPQTGGGTEAGGGSEPTDPAADATDPIYLSPGLEYVRYDYPKPWNGGLSFCYYFEVKNTSSEPIEWAVAFNTALAPMYGASPDDGTVRDLSNLATRSFDATTGRWEVGGVGWNSVVQPGQSAGGQFCAYPETPEVDQSTFTTPQVTLESGSNEWSAALRIQVQATADQNSPRWHYPVPWEAEVDLADYVCAAALPESIKGTSFTGENAYLEHIEGTRYRVTGTGTSSLVSGSSPINMVFYRFDPQGAKIALKGCVAG